MEDTNTNDKIAIVDAISNTLTQMNKIIDDIEKNINRQANFNMALRTFNAAASELIGFISNPAILLIDTSGNIHHMVSGEKWKLFMTINLFYSLNGNEGVREIYFTNPLKMAYESIKIDKNGAIQALRNYEFMYDHSIQEVMKINAEASNIMAVKTNPDKKVEILRKVTSMIEDAINMQMKMYFPDSGKGT